jgi:LEA14-like dessication related protein
MVWTKPVSIRSAIRLFYAASLLWITACSMLPAKPVKPDIELIDVKPLNVSLTEQKLRFTLKVSNPNNFELPVESIDFIARFNGSDIANGKSNQAVTIPASSDGELTLDVTAGLDRMVSTLKTLLEGETLNLDYELAGTVKIENWSTPIPFDVVGAMNVESPPDS